LVISETITPYIYENGELIQHARVIVGIAIKEAKANYGKVKDSIAVPLESEMSIPEHMTPEGKITDKEVKARGNASAENTGDDVKIEAEDIVRVLNYAKIL